MEDSDLNGAPHTRSRLGTGPLLYCAWAALAIGFSIAKAGLSPESITRILVVLFLAAQIALREPLARALPGLAPRLRFVVMGTLLAAVVEGFHMISMPVRPSLTVTPGMPVATALHHYGVDLLLTVPAYLVIFSVIYWFISRYRYGLWQYVLVMGAAQALGDGGIYFFAAAPAMLVFLPYPMTNYHAVNVIPYLAVRDQLPAERRESRLAWLALPAVIVTYFVCGAAIKLVG